MVRLDLNNEIFQTSLFSLEKKEQHQVLKVLRKLSQMSWQQIYADNGLHWEKIYSFSPTDQRLLYSLRISLRHRAVAYRDEDWLVLLSLHPDHDSAYD